MVITSASRSRCARRGRCAARAAPPPRPPRRERARQPLARAAAGLERHAPRASPAATSPPDSACTMNSVVGRSAYGPGAAVRRDRAHDEARVRVEQRVRVELRRRRSSRSRRRRRRRGRSTSASPGARRPSASRGAGTGTARRRSAGSTVAPPRPTTRASGSPPGGSTFTTSAPASASRRAQYAAGDPGAEVDDAQRRQALLHGSGRSVDGTEVRQREPALHLVELDLDPHADLDRVVLGSR